MARHVYNIVMAALEAAVQLSLFGWMAGSSPAMTKQEFM